MSALSHLPDAEAQLLADRTLLVRTDTKFVLHRRELPVLTGLLKAENYAAARHPGGDFFAYENRYFDTTERLLLRAHHRGQRPRYKVRLRHHLSRNMSFFELKQKQPGGATSKERIPVGFQTDGIGPEASALLEHRHRLTSRPLESAMCIDFERAMLVGRDTPERVSIDTNLRFSDGDSTAELNDLVIVEVKQARFAARSPVMRALRTSGALQLRVSKYITGAQLLWPDVRLNRYRNRYRMMRRRIA
jgi:hypothetical protein